MIRGMTLTIGQMLVCGFVAGLLIGVTFPHPKLGCVGLLAVPVGMFVYIWWWQSENPDKLRSTSGLDFVFGPLWPSLGAIAGYLAGMTLRSLLPKR